MKAALLERYTMLRGIFPKASNNDGRPYRKTKTLLLPGKRTQLGELPGKTTRWLNGSRRVTTRDSPSYITNCHLPSQI